MIVLRMQTLECFSRSSKPLSTIRFRAMLQDTGYAMELYLPSDVGSSSVTPMDMGNLRERWVGWAIESASRLNDPKQRSMADRPA